MTTPTLSLAAALLLVASLHSVGLSAALLRSRRQPQLARLSLAALALVIAVLLAQMTLVFSGLDVPGRVVVGSLWLAIGPLFYLYVRSLLPERPLAPEDLLHALPFLFQLGVIVSFAFAPAATPEAVEAGRPAVGFSFVLLYGVQTVLYAVVTWSLVESMVTRFRREVSGRAAEAVTGLRPLALCFAVYAAALSVNIGVLMVTGAFIEWLDYLVPLALSVLVGVIGYGLLRRPEQVLPALVLPSVPAPEPTPTPEAGRQAAALRDVLATERPYLNPDVRLSDLSESMNVPERVVSQVLTDAFGGSFYDVINGYRVEEAKARLADPRHAHLTVLAVGLDAGFSSKATFNRVFKKATGQTPSEYRRRAPEPLAPPSGDGALEAAEVVSTGANEAHRARWDASGVA